MSDTLHAVLGGTGVIGRETTAALQRRGIEPVVVAREPRETAGIRSRAADLLDPAATRAALDGAEVAYLTVALPYSGRVWEAQWPALVRNVADAALAHGTRLVVLDNVYAYGPVDGPMTEQTPIRPTSRKGRARAAALPILAEAAARGLDVAIARSADFYGPGAATSVFNGFAIDPIAAGRDATWFFDADQPHSLSYTPDVAEGLVTLGTDPRGRSGVWHLPTGPALTGREYVALASDTARCRTMSLTTMRFGALFNRSARETLEMAYQYTSPYVFDSSAFERTFGTAPTPYRSGIEAALNFTRSRAAQS